MGHSVWSDVVPFVMHEVMKVSHNDTWERFSEEEEILLNPECWASGYAKATRAQRDVLEKNPHREAVLRGWKIALFTDNPEFDDTNFGKKKRIWGHIWKKDDLMVCLVNESEYSDIGEIRLSVVANDKRSIKQFKKDFEFSQKIEKKDCVTQSG